MFLMTKEWENNAITQQDIDTITEDFIENENEPAHFRAISISTCASDWYTQAGPQFNLDAAAELLRQGLDIIAASPTEDDNRTVLYAPYSDIGFRTGEGDLIGPRDFTLKGVLCYLDEKTRKHLLKLCSVRKMPAVVTGILPPPLKAQVEMLYDRARAGGLVCDCCGKTPEELQIPSFQRCSRCLMVFYCSPTCQREHWKKKGHKQACRENGEIKIGDDMRVHNPTMNTFEFVMVSGWSSTMGQIDSSL